MFHHLNHGGSGSVKRKLEKNGRLLQDAGSKRYGIPAGADRRTGVVGRQCAKRQINIGKIHTNPTFPSYDGFIMPQMEENGNYEKCNKL